MKIQDLTPAQGSTKKAKRTGQQPRGIKVRKRDLVVQKGHPLKVDKHRFREDFPKGASRIIRLNGSTQF